MHHHTVHNRNVVKRNRIILGLQIRLSVTNESEIVFNEFHRRRNTNVYFTSLLCYGAYFTEQNNPDLHSFGTMFACSLMVYVHDFFDCGQILGSQAKHRVPRIRYTV